MTIPEIVFDITEAITLIERDERTEGGEAPFLETGRKGFREVIVLGNTAPDLTMASLEGYVPLEEILLTNPLSK